jgi:hypothetical protein
MAQVLELIAVLACTVFTGAAIYIVVAEHPARLSCGTEIAATEFVPSYKRAAVMQASLAIVAGLSGLARSAVDGELQWAWAGLLILSVVPFTLVVIRPTNTRLLDPRLDRASDEAGELLNTWGRLHLIRTLISAAASVLYVWTAITT